jgi:energy-coupling factor transport system permease protein
VLAVVFGFLYWALVQAWAALQIAMGPFGDLAQHVLIGGWMVVAPLALYIVRKPGVGVVVELVAALVEVAFLASPVGPMLLLVGLVQGVGAELAFTLTRYRRYGWWVFVASGVTAALASTLLGTVRYGWHLQDLFALRIGLQVVSGIVLCGLLARVLGDALARTGVLDETALGRERRARRAAAGVPA